MTKGRRVTALVLLAAALVLASLGQYYFFQRRDYLWDGLVFHLLAALCFVLAWRLSLPKKRQVHERGHLPVAPWLRQNWVPAILLVSLTATSVGYAIAHLSPKPELVAVLTQFIIFSLFLFSPINFPAERLPGWLADLHQFLPVKHAADAIRGSLTEVYAADLGRAMLTLSVWCAAALAATYMVVSRRR